MMRYIMSYGVALVLLLLIAGWLASGTLVQGGKGPGNGEQAIIDLVEVEEDGPVRQLFASLGLISEPEDLGEEGVEDTTETDDETPELQTVRTAHYVAELMQIEVDVRGQTNAIASVSVRAETNGIVDAVHVQKGDVVAPGDLLCSLDQGTRLTRLAQGEASLAQAQAALAQSQADFETNAALREKGLAAANTARQFEVALTSANASISASISALDDIKSDLEKTQVFSQVSGVVQDPMADAGDVLNNSGICATIVQMNPMLFAGKVAEANISAVSVGMNANVTMVTGQAVSGIVRYVSTSADRATRAFEVEVELDNSNGSLRDGVTSTAKIQVGAIPAHLIPQSTLTLETDGTLGVRIVSNGVSSFRPITIIVDEPGGIWVAGLPTEVDIIILGQEFVVDGQQVEAVDGSIGVGEANS